MMCESEIFMKSWIRGYCKLAVFYKWSIYSGGTILFYYCYAVVDF